MPCGVRYDQCYYVLSGIVEHEGNDLTVQFHRFISARKGSCVPAVFEPPGEVCDPVVVAAPACVERYSFVLVHGSVRSTRRNGIGDVLHRNRHEVEIPVSPEIGDRKIYGEYPGLMELVADVHSD